MANKEVIFLGVRIGNLFTVIRQLDFSCYLSNSGDERELFTLVF